MAIEGYMTNAEIRETHNMLVEYKQQLLKRHATNPQQAPPLFLLEAAIARLQVAFKISKTKKKRH